MSKKEVISSTSLIKRKKRMLVIVSELKRIFPKTKTALKFSNPLELLIAVILSAQCTDKKVNEVTEKLFKKYRTLSDYVDAKQSEFEKDIRSTGFFRNKTKNILASAKLIKNNFSGKVPQTMEELLTLPGVARKTANVVLSSGFGITEGIAVDTHVKRLSRLHGLTNETDPNRIEQDLMQLLPKKQWPGFNHRLVDYGRQFCPAKKHDHENCPLEIKLRGIK